VQARLVEFPEVQPSGRLENSKAHGPAVPVTTTNSVVDVPRAKFDGSA
jgi:hypothetical protein